MAMRGLHNAFCPAPSGQLGPPCLNPVLCVRLNEENSYEAVARLLIDKGADVKAQNKDGSTALI